MNAPTPARLSAAELIDLVLDEGSWSSWDVPPSYGEISEAYAAELAAAREKSGVDESVLTGEGLMHGRRVAVVMGEFRFLAGSIGRASADRLVAAIERATREGLPLLAGPISGGTRMQEGTPAFVQMVGITAGGRRAQGRRPALPRLPAPPHHRRRDGVLGLARPPDRRRARRADRLPRAAGLRGALRQALPRGRADRGEPLRPRHRRRGPAARGGRRHPDRALDDPARAAPRDRPVPDPVPLTAAPRRRVGRRHPLPAAGPARVRGCCGTPPAT